MTINPAQRLTLLFVLLGLIGWLIYYLWILVGGRYQRKRQDSSIEVETQSSYRLNQALLILDQFQQQPTLDLARVNFLRQLSFADLHDLVLLALAAVKYTIRMDQPAIPYELSPFESAEFDSDPLSTVDLVTLSSAPTNKNRSSHSSEEVRAGFDPVISSNNLFTADGCPVLFSIQVAGSSYSSHGFSRLSEACILENLPGLLVYLGTDSLIDPPISPVVILTGIELLAILDGLENE